MNEQPQEFKIFCPNCGQHLSYDSTMFDQVFQCPTCGKEVRTPSMPDPEPAPVVVDVVRRGDGGEKRKRLLRAIGIASAAVVVVTILAALGYRLSQEKPSESYNNAPNPSKNIVNLDDQVKKCENTLAILEKNQTFPTNPATAKKVVQDLLSLNKDTKSKYILEAACAGMIALDDNAGYAKTKDRLPRLEAFEKEILDICQECNGSGSVRADCSNCHGSGILRDSEPQPEQQRRQIRRVRDPRVGTDFRIVVVCPDCNGSEKSQIRCSRCKGQPKTFSREKAKDVFANRIEKATTECKRQLASEREKLFEMQQRARGLVPIQGKWATLGSRFDLVLTVLQKLPNRGITTSRPPKYGEHGGLLCVDSTGEVGCIIVTAEEWHNAQEKKSYRFNIYRCGEYSYTTVKGVNKVVMLFATDLETALGELGSGKYSEEFD